MQKNVLITGATDGIGRLLADLYHNRGVELITVGRRRRSVEPKAPGDYCCVDLSVPESARAVAHFVAERGLDGLDVIVHNAAWGYYGPPQDQSFADIERILAVNLAAPIALTQRLLPLLEKRKGRVVFIGSLASAMACPDYAVYAASKAALDGFARSLRCELASTVRVQTIHPGAVRTRFHQKVGAPFDAETQRRFVSPEHAARRILEAIDKGRPQAFVRLTDRIAFTIGRLLPGVLDGLVLRGRR